MAKPLLHHEESSRGGGGRGLGGPPPNIPYGGRAQQVYTPPSQRSAAPAPSAPASGKSSTAASKATPAAPASTKRQASSKSRYGSIAPMKPLAKAPIFESTQTLSLDAKSDPNSEWQTYAGADNVNTVSIQRSALPSPLPKKIKVKFEPA